MNQIKTLTHTFRERGERGGGSQGHTPPLPLLHVVAVAASDEQLIKENSLERTAGLPLTLYKSTMVGCSAADTITHLQPF